MYAETLAARLTFSSIILAAFALFAPAAFAQNISDALKPQTIDSAKNVPQGGGAPPDIAGLRIGMPAAEARAIIKSRFLVSAESQKSYKENFAELTYTLPGTGRHDIVPNSKFLASIQVGQVGLTGGSAGYLHGFSWIFVAFAPIPGNETVVWIDKRDEIAVNERTTYGVFHNALVAKYGTPTNWKPERPELHSWYYDQNNRLAKPGPIRGRATSDTTTVCQFGLSMTDLMIRVPQIGQYGNTYDQLPQECGATVLSVKLASPSGTWSPDTPVVLYLTRLIGFDAYIRSIKASHAIVDEARETASKAAIKAGQARKPDL